MTEMPVGQGHIHSRVPWMSKHMLKPCTISSDTSPGFDLIGPLKSIRSLSFLVVFVTCLLPLPQTIYPYVSL